MWYAVISGLGIGLFGSFHCIGMCGPIALALPVYGKSVLEKLLLIVLYNLGRASTYGVLGLLFGFIGKQFFLFGYQQLFSISVGCLMLLILFAGKYFSYRPVWMEQLQLKIKELLARSLQSGGRTFSYYIVGMVNGLLPCGLVYMAVSAAMASGNPWYGASLMFLFGLGTMPLMLSLMIFRTYISAAFRSRMRKLVPVFVCLTACMLILRGIGLGIPYLSPVLHAEQSNFQQVQCHK